MPSYSSILSVAALLLLPFAAAGPVPSATQSSNAPPGAKPAKDTPDSAESHGTPFAHNNEVILKSLPLTANGKKLPEPAGLALRYVTIGRGVQNYTCATSTASSVPVAIGALAVLYDVTARALLDPNIVTLMANTAVDLPSTSFILPNRPLDIPNVGTYPVIGDHFFLADGTPTFDIFDVGKRAFCKLLTKIKAPDNASKGPAKTGAVDWLALVTKEPSVGLAQVYRVSTAGGVAPATCAGQPKVISIPYAAAYHFYGWM